MNGGSFGNDFEEFARKTLLRADLLKRAVSIKLFSAIIKDSPTGDPDLWKSQQGKDRKDRKGPQGYVGGRLKGNWNCTVGQADTEAILAPEGYTTTAEYKNFPTEADRLKDVYNVCQASDRKEVNWLANSLPYVARVEYDGWSRQAPAGMVRRNHARFKRLVSQQLAQLKSNQ